MIIWAIVRNFWAIVPDGFNHYGPAIYSVAKHGMPTALGFIGF